MNNFMKKCHRLGEKIKKDDVFAWASMLTLFLLLSLFPIIMLLTDVITRSSLNDPQVTNFIINMLPGPVYDTIRAIAKDIETSQPSGFIPTAILVTLWSASRGMLAIIRALNKAYEVKETRSYFHLRALAVLYTLGFLVLIIITLILLVFGNNIYYFIADRVTLPDFLTPLFEILRFTFTITFAMTFFTLLYNLTPATKNSIRGVLPGTIISSIGLIGTSGAFSIYVRYSQSLSYLYGSLTGFMLLIIWLFLVSVIIMIGGEINAVFAQNMNE